jgi:hypothetical protein
MPEVEREYTYRSGWGFVIFCILMALICAGSAISLVIAALHNDRGLNLRGILGVIELGPAQATVFYWVAAVFLGAFTALPLWLIYERFTSRQRLAFTSDSLIAPAPGLRPRTGEIEIPYRTISKLTPVKGAHDRYLFIDHARGRFVVMAAKLASRAAFDEVCERLEAKLKSGRTDPIKRSPRAS